MLQVPKTQVSLLVQVQVPTTYRQIHPTGVWSRSRRLGLETVSRRLVLVSSRTKCSTSRSRLGFGLKGLGVSSWVSNYFVSSRRFVQVPAVHRFSSPILVSTSCASELQSAFVAMHRLLYVVNINCGKLAFANASYFVTGSCTCRLVANGNKTKHCSCAVI